MKKLDKLEVELYYERSTKNVHIYWLPASYGPLIPPIRALHIGKSVAQKPPQRIKVTVEEVQ